jgi:hypothetical protein
MHHIRLRINILINIALFVCALTLAFCIAEYILRITAIEELSGHKIWVGEQGNSKYYPLLTPVLATACKDFKFISGNCYPSDTTGRLPLKVINPYDGNYWYCVAYNKQQRRQGYNPNRKRQIALVGDSFVFGEGLKETDTLGYRLNVKYPEVNFLNRGKGGANIDDVVQQCKEIIESVPAVEEVIYFYNLNDVRMSQMVSSQQKHIIDFQNIQWSIDEHLRGSLVKVLSKSALFSLVRKTWVIKRESSLTVHNYKDMYLSENNRQEFLSTMDDMKSIKDMLAARGISFRMIIYPLLYKDLLGRYPFEPVHAAIINACYERGIICLDGYEPFKSYYSMKRFAVHPIDYHPNGLSNRKLVNYIHKINFITGRPEQ